MRRMHKRSKRVTAVLVLLGLLALWLYWENNAIQTTRVFVSSDRLPASFDGFRVVHISDLHNRGFGEGQERLLKLVREEAPDLIAITGDLMDTPEMDNALAFVAGAARIAPVYYVTGNHEARIKAYGTLEAKLTQAGAVVLRDEGVTIRRGGEAIRLLGLDDPSFTPRRDGGESNAQFTHNKLKSMVGQGDRYTILLSHRPELFDVYGANQLDLILCGHAHGGQVRLPLLGGIIAPNQGLFPPYTQGLHEQGQTSMVVSRGLGHSIIPLRVNNRPELVVIELGGVKKSGAVLRLPHSLVVLPRTLWSGQGCYKFLHLAPGN